MPRIVHVEKLGGPEFLTINDAALAEPGPGEVRLKVDAFALNRADILYITGSHYTELKLPSRIGSEAAGIVDSVGPGVDHIKVGDRVSTVPFFTTQSERHGVQGEFAIVPAGYVAPWPEGFTATEACSVWMQYLTAYFALVTVGELSIGKSVLIAAAASSAGVGAIQMAKALGANVIATTRQEQKIAFLKSVGADHVIVTKKGVDFSLEIRAATQGRGVDVVFDPVSGRFAEDYCHGLNWAAKILNYGQLDDEDPIFPILPITRVKGTIHPYSMFNHVMFPDELAEGIAFVMRQISEGRFRPVIDHIFQFDQTMDAYNHMLGNSQCGKIVVRVTDDAGN
ncbi:zinc-dependent alcohol dehydrogenase family protein [Rhizobium sp. KVB221]|uniref:Zinc-dependent alcohol dehydrogenase family protein n=1 Tax=Rhizobium setariae TaxID=2801340 RepID=A0A937CM49_9HYPH|nr:zinc-dependent alcohol dehydrogenase family protein [Rhizobium setariae]MBL0372366.1 zinc-dependent alcohol dehydrogenase family protein [Rhizobium setariae]